LFIIGNLLNAVGYILNTVIGAFIWIIIISALLSWVNADPYNPIVMAINRLSGIIVNPLRRWGKFYAGPIDFSPMIAILILIFLQRFLVRSILDLSMRLR